MIHIAIISNKDKFASKLTKVFTGSYAYHIGFVDIDNNKFYDQNLLFRRRVWPYYKDKYVKLYKCPVEVTSKDLETWLETNSDTYGFMDYLSFAIRKFLPDMDTNAKGVICSEAVNNILKSKGWDSPSKEVPSPADFEKILEPV